MIPLYKYTAVVYISGTCTCVFQGSYIMFALILKCFIDVYSLPSIQDLLLKKTNTQNLEQLTWLTEAHATNADFNHYSDTKLTTIDTILLPVWWPWDSDAGLLRTRAANLQPLSFTQTREARQYIPTRCHSFVRFVPTATFFTREKLLRPWHGQGHTAYYPLIFQTCGVLITNQTVAFWLTHTRYL